MVSLKSSLLIIKKKELKDLEYVENKFLKRKNHLPFIQILISSYPPTTPPTPPIKLMHNFILCYYCFCT